MPQPILQKLNINLLISNLKFMESPISQRIKATFSISQQLLLHYVHILMDFAQRLSLLEMWQCEADSNDGNDYDGLLLPTLGRKAHGSSTYLREWHGNIQDWPPYNEDVSDDGELQSSVKRGENLRESKLEPNSRLNCQPLNHAR